MHVLIVEDDSNIAGLLMDYLQMQGHRADWASSGPRALALLEEQRFDVIVLDRGLPRMEGLRFLRLMREDMKISLPGLRKNPAIEKSTCCQRVTHVTQLSERMNERPYSEKADLVSGLSPSDHRLRSCYPMMQPRQSLLKIRAAA